MEAQALRGDDGNLGRTEELEGKSSSSQRRLKSCIDALIESSKDSLSSEEAVEAATDELMNELRASGSARHKAVDLLLGALRLPNLPDRVQESIASAISLCSGAYTNHSASSYRTFSFSPSLRVNIHEIDFVDGGVGWKVWGGALLLSQRMIEIPSLVKHKRVLELGSGCGLCGIVASKLGATEVVLTDYLPSLLLNLRRNISLFRNQRKEIQRQFSYSSRTVSYDNHITCGAPEDLGPKVEASQDDYLFPGDRTIRLRTLDWLETSGTKAAPLECLKLDLQLPPTVTSEGPFDVVIASDVLYEERLIQPFVATMARHMARPHGKGLIVAPVREKRLLELFLKEVEHLKLRATIVQVEATEWSRCKAIVNGDTEGAYDDEFLEDQQGTMQEIDYYDAGYVSITVTQKLVAEPIDI